MKKILISLMTLVLVVGMVGAGAFAYFSDVETSEDNTFTAGTLDLKVDGNDDPYVVHVELSNLKPGDGSQWGGWGSQGALYWTVKNVGSIPGELTITINNVVNYENGQTEPEALVDPTAGTLEGELGNYFRPQVFFNGPWVYETGSITWIGTTGAEIVPGYGASPVTLGPGEEKTLQINWLIYDTAGNEIQSDSVEFDIEFTLDQA